MMVAPCGVDGATCEGYVYARSLYCKASKNILKTLKTHSNHFGRDDGASWDEECTPGKGGKKESIEDGGTKVFRSKLIRE